jgi:hypothetical protein
LRRRDLEFQIKKIGDKRESKDIRRER